MADTALTIITDAMMDIGVLADGEAPTASQAAGALRKLNNMIESWNIDELMLYGHTSHVMPFVANQSVYTVGTGGSINIDRPDYIEGAYIRDTTLPAANVQDIPLYIYNDQEWDDVAFKSMNSAYPNYGIYIYYDFPLIKLYPLPVPNSSQYQLVIWVKGQITSFSTLTQQVQLPSGYKRALTSNLCIEIAPSYSLGVPDDIRMIARNSKDDLRVKNFQLSELVLDPRICSRYFDIKTGRYI